MKSVELYTYDKESKRVLLIETEVDDNFEFEFVPQVVRVKNVAKNKFENKIIKIRKDLVLANAEASGERLYEIKEEEVPAQVEPIEVVEETPVEEGKGTKSKKASSKKGTSTSKE